MIQKRATVYTATCDECRRQFGETTNRELLVAILADHKCDGVRRQYAWS